MDNDCKINAIWWYKKDKEFRKEHEEVRTQITNKHKRIDDLKSKVYKFEEEIINLLDGQAKLLKLYKIGFIDDH